MENSETNSTNASASKTKCKDNPVVRATTYPTQSFVDKVGRNKSFSVLKSKIDFENKCIHFNIAKGDNASLDVDITFEAACKMFGWTSFTWSDDFSILYPKFPGHVPEIEPDYHVMKDSHFGDPNYNWMSELRVTSPMNSDTDGVRELNEQLHANDGAYYSEAPIRPEENNNLVASEPEEDNQLEEPAEA